jgi:TRAP-type mannitol/chloroaromatic compound transport system permease small subunit
MSSKYESQRCSRKGAKMPKVIKMYVRAIDKVNTVIGRITMYMVFLMIGILLYEPIARNLFGISSIWAVETAQFTMAAYYLVGGAYSMILDGHVRMDLLYGRWSNKKQARVDSITDLFLIFYLVFLLVGAYSSIEYAVMYGQKNRSAWAPYMAPIKIIMGFGVLMMLLQAIATFFKDLAQARGEKI